MSRPAIAFDVEIEPFVATSGMYVSIESGRRELRRRARRSDAQWDVDELGDAIGVHYDDFEELRCGDKERDRDRRRWELDPASAEDWLERMRGEVRTL